MEKQRTLFEQKPHATRSPAAWVLAAGACSLLLALLARDAAAQTPAPQEPAPTPAPSPKPAATFSAGSWAFKLGGYVKLDAIHDFDPIGSTDSFNPRTIPVPGGEGTNTRFHARESRVSLAVVGPAEGRDLKLVVEGDFYGANNGIRLRHAYGQYGLLLAGQTWTTFMDEDNIPNTIDFETPLAQPLVRQGLVRFTFDLSKRTLLAFGIEESDPRLLPPPGVEGTTEKALPDFTARLRFTSGRGHVQLSGFVGQVRFRPTTGDPIDVTIGGAMASARFRVFRRDSAYAQISGGPGLGRYRGEVSVAPDASGELKAVEVTAFMVGYQHYWTSALVLQRGGEPGLGRKRPGRGPRPRPPLRLRRGEPALLVHRRPRLGRGRVSLRPEGSAQRRAGLREPRPVRRSLQHPRLVMLLE